MKKLISLMIISLLLNGCAGVGLNKKATLMPDEVWIQQETAPTGTSRDYKTLKIVGGAKWKLQ